MAALRAGDRGHLPVSTAPGVSYDHAVENVGRLVDAGATILAGTDANDVPGHAAAVLHGASMHLELELLARAGLTPRHVPARRDLAAGGACSASPTAAGSRRASAPTCCSSRATRSATSPPPVTSAPCGARASVSDGVSGRLVETLDGPREPDRRHPNGADRHNG